MALFCYTIKCMGTVEVREMVHAVFHSCCFVLAVFVIGVPFAFTICFPTLDNTVKITVTVDCSLQLHNHALVDFNVSLTV